MATTTRTLRQAHELKQFLDSQGLGKEDIYYIGHNQSGHIDVVFDDETHLSYVAGVGSANVDIPVNSRVHDVWISADGSDVTATIFGGDTITIQSGSTFQMDFKGRLVGATAPDARIVIGANGNYFISYIDRS